MKVVFIAFSWMAIAMEHSRYAARLVLLGHPFSDLCLVLRHWGLWNPHSVHYP